MQCHSRQPGIPGGSCGPLAQCTPGGLGGPGGPALRADLAVLAEVGKAEALRGLALLFAAQAREYKHDDGDDVGQDLRDLCRDRQLHSQFPQALTTLTSVSRQLPTASETTGQKLTTVRQPSISTSSSYGATTMRLTSPSMRTSSITISQVTFSPLLTQT